MSITFGSNFLDDYAPNLINDPEVAIVEILSNCSDAGADTVEITWPEKEGGDIYICDNGIGMTRDEFSSYWNELSYNRRETSVAVEYPPNNRKGQRKLFGRNGKGRLSLFCFDFEYRVRTTKDNDTCFWKVTRNLERGPNPFTIELMNEEIDKRSLHGTTVSCKAMQRLFPESRLVELIGATFLSDPSLAISVNGSPVELTDLQNAQFETLSTLYGEIEFYILDRRRRGRSSQQYGVSWHVNNKRVGTNEWQDPLGFYEIDERTTQAHRYSIVVVADFLEKYVNSDWTAFRKHEIPDTVRREANIYIRGIISRLFAEQLRERKSTVLKDNEQRLETLSEFSQERIIDAIDDVQGKIPTTNEETLNALVGALANIEDARTGYGLLEQLAAASPDDIDTLYEILSKWSIQDARIVLELLGTRLSLIKQLQRVVNTDADELHEIHPLFEQGLWIFGPEYESVYYRSNSWLSTVIRRMLGDKVVEIEGERRRPDLVALPDSRVRVFSHNSFDDRGEVKGLSKVLILELKGGGSSIGIDAMLQVESYAREIAKSGNIQSDTEVLCFALGSTLGDGSDSRTVGNNIRIEARTYDTVIEQAQARTYYLLHKIEEATAGNSPIFMIAAGAGK